MKNASKFYRAINYRGSGRQKIGTARSRARKKSKQTAEWAFEPATHVFINSINHWTIFNLINGLFTAQRPARLIELQNFGAFKAPRAGSAELWMGFACEWQSTQKAHRAAFSVLDQRKAEEIFRWSMGKQSVTDEARECSKKQNKCEVVESAALGDCCQALVSSGKTNKSLIHGLSSQHRDCSFCMPERRRRNELFEPSSHPGKVYDLSPHAISTLSRRLRAFAMVCLTIDVFEHFMQIATRVSNESQMI